MRPGGVVRHGAVVFAGQQPRAVPPAVVATDVVHGLAVGVVVVVAVARLAHAEVARVVAGAEDVGQEVAGQLAAAARAGGCADPVDVPVGRGVGEAMSHDVVTAAVVDHVAEVRTRAAAVQVDPHGVAAVGQAAVIGLDRLDVDAGVARLVRQSVVPALRAHPSDVQDVAAVRVWRATGVPVAHRLVVGAAVAVARTGRVAVTAVLVVACAVTAAGVDAGARIVAPDAGARERRECNDEKEGREADGSALSDQLTRACASPFR